MKKIILIIFALACSVAIVKSFFPSPSRDLVDLGHSAVRERMPKDRVAILCKGLGDGLVSETNTQIIVTRTTYRGFIFVILCMEEFTVDFTDGRATSFKIRFEDAAI